jgi:hypothetical protein
MSIRASNWQQQSVAIHHDNSILMVLAMVPTTVMVLVDDFV